jgi:parallel beta-helix repeat protein
MKVKCEFLEGGLRLKFHDTVHNTYLNIEIFRNDKSGIVITDKSGNVIKDNEIASVVELLDAIERFYHK